MYMNIYAQTQSIKRAEHERQHEYLESHAHLASQARESLIMWP